MLFSSRVDDQNKRGGESLCVQIYTVPVYNEQQNEVVHHSVYHSLRKKKKRVSVCPFFFANRIMAGASAIERKKKGMNSPQRITQCLDYIDEANCVNLFFSLFFVFFVLVSVILSF